MQSKESIQRKEGILENSRERIKSGMVAYAYLQKMRQDKLDLQEKSAFEAHKDDLGYGLLLKRYTDKAVDATPTQIDGATRHSIPKVAPMFWTFRGMV